MCFINNQLTYSSSDVTMLSHHLQPSTDLCTLNTSCYSLRDLKWYYKIPIECTVKMCLVNIQQVLARRHLQGQNEYKRKVFHFHSTDPREWRPSDTRWIFNKYVSDSALWWYFTASYFLTLNLTMMLFVSEFFDAKMPHRVSCGPLNDCACL